MNELIKHIEILLLNHDCVIIPGFGGFTTQHVDSCYDESDQTFFPPKRTIGFNSQLKMNDSLLAQSYIEAFDLSYPDAVNRIENEVEMLWEHLNDSNVLEMGTIGTFTKNDEGKLEFTPCQAGVLTPRYYGLGTCEIKQINNVSNSSSEFNNVVNHSFTSKIKQINSLRNIAAACFILFAILAIPQLKKFGGASNNSDTSQLAENSQTYSSDQASHFKKGMSVASIGFPSFVKNAGKLDLLFVTESTGKPYYSIILASHVTMKNATEFVEHLHNTGYPEAKILPKQVGTKVLYGQFESEEDAYNTLKQLKDKADFAEAWVMKVDN